jgi:hypothetical protein
LKKETNKNKKINLILYFLFSCICFFSFIDIASAARDVSGYAWSENIGWVNFDSGNIVNSSLSFDGVEDYVEIPNSASINNTRVFSFSFWFYVNNFTGPWVSLFGKMDNEGTVASRNFVSFLNSNGSVYACSADTTGQQCATTAVGTIETGKWYNYAAVIDRNNGTIKIYINGEEAASNTVRVSDAVTNENPIYIGSHRYAYDVLDGYFDNAALWNIALTQQQIKDQMWTELGGTETGLVGYWDFNEGTGSTVNDKTSNNNDGTVVGGTWYNNDYGVSVGDDNILIGYAWSDNIGWVSFNASDLTGCPSGTCSANLVGSKIVGWAKQISDSETGWIKLGPIDIGGTDYGLYTNSGYILGWAWSDAFGWLSFSCENEDECATSNYAVKYGSNVVVDNLAADINYCGHDSLATVNDGLSITFSWDFTSDYSQRGYSFQIATNAEFNSPFSVNATTSSTSYILDLEGSAWNGEQLNWGGTYYWRVKATNIAGSSSAWADGSFTIDRTHGSPWAKASFSPQQILPERPITFDASESVVYNASTPTYYWTFEGGDPATSEDVDEVVVFNTESDFTTVLRVTDGTGYYCEKSADVNVIPFNPIWRDVSPF